MKDYDAIYNYPPWVYPEIEKNLRIAMPGGLRITRATRAQDVRGVDLIYQAASAAIQVRCRFDRPIDAPWIDITFRTTEPRMMAARTYAPLALFLWCDSKLQVVMIGFLVDIYRMVERMPHLTQIDEEQIISNGDGTEFFCVPTEQLIRHRAILRNGGRRGWATLAIDGDRRLETILEQGVPTMRDQA